VGFARLKTSCNTQIKLVSGNEGDVAIGEDLTRFAEDPEGFIRYLEPDIVITGQQITILESVKDKRVTNVAACHGLGKTYLSGWLVLWAVFAVRSLVISTAPTHRQVTKLLWGVVRRLYDKHKKKLGGKRNELRVFLEEGVEAYGFSSSDHNDSAAQGIHSERMLIIEDEACGISPAVDTSLESCLTGEQNKILRIGNPTRCDSPFYTACNLSHIRCSAWAHPNIEWAYDLHLDGMHRLKPDVEAKIKRSPNDPNSRDEPIKPQSEWDADLPRDIIKGAISIAWIERMRIKKGENSPFWLTRIEGLFSESGGASILPKSYFVAARARYDLNPALWETIINVNTPWSFGVDVGSMSDDHAICGFQGNVLKIARVIPCIGDRKDVIRIAQIIEEEYLQVYPNCKVGIDATGVGSGTLAYLLDRGWGSQVWAANFGDAVEEDSNQDFDQLYMNWKAQWYWKLREFFAAADGNDDISAIAPLEEEEYIMTDFSNVYYEETPNAKLRIEDKATKTIRRLGRSPNCSDACVIAFAGRESLMDTLWRSGY
jgi:hypothetical protein